MTGSVLATMPFPNYPDKHDAPTHLSPEALLGSVTEEDVNVPKAIILCYQPRFFEHIIEEYSDSEITGFPGAERQLYALSGTGGRIGVLGGFGIGGPATAACMEELIAHGTETFCIVGGCGGLGENAVPHEPVICDRAIRDEGVSHHYLPTEKYASASDSLVTHLEDALDTAGLDYQTGTSWTTDAIYRETVPEIEHYCGEGVLTVEMEVATAFAVADYRGKDAAALLCPFDRVMADDWEPDGRNTVDGLRDLLAPTRDALETHLPQ